VAAGLALLFVLGASLTATAQNQFVPYYGKARVKYDKFNWQIYETDHFEMFYYPELEQHLERVAGYAESAYQQVSSDLKHELAFKIPLVLFKTHSEFEQQNVIPADMPEGVAAFAEPMRNRMVLPIDEPPDELYRLITHELTHIFEFDIIPRAVVRSSVPLWVDEGLADYLAGVWHPLDLMTVRDAAVADIVPKLTVPDEFFGFSSPRLPYNLGHAAFEFMETRAGKDGIRQFLFALRKNVIGGGGDAYQEALNLSAEEFDIEFSRYIKDRFRAFRDKERPEDYGANLAPDPRESEFVAVYSIEPSPSGDLLAAMATNVKDRELDIVLVSVQDGSIVRNLTPGFSQDEGYEYITLPGARWNTVPWMSWSPAGDRIGYFVRKGKRKTLIVRDVVSGDIEERVDMTMVDEPESPDIALDGSRVAFSALQNAIGDIYIADLVTGDVTNVTNDDFADYAPTFSPDGQSIVYMTRISGNNKLFRLDLETGEKLQLTFGTHDETAAQFLDDDRVVFSSTAVDPLQPIDPEMARNGNIFNLWTLSLSTGALEQYTDALTGNVSAVVLGAEAEQQVAFVSYFKGNYGIHAMEVDESLYSAATSDFGAPGPIIDFQAPLTHTLITDNNRQKGAFEKMFLEGRPPVNLGVTNSGDLYGGSQLTFTDVLGEQQFNLYAASIAEFRTLAFSYTNLSSRLQWGTQAYSQTQFFFGTPTFQSFGLLNRDQAIATTTARGGTVFGIYPFSKFRRLEMSAGVAQYNERFDDPALEEFNQELQEQQFGTQLFRNGVFVPLNIAFVQETTVFREFGPIAGNTMRLGFGYSPKVGNSLTQRNIDADARYYLRLGETGSLALRARGFQSWGESPDYLFFGGNSELRGYDYLEFVGHKAFHMNAELRFPLVEAMLTPIGVMGGFRGVFFLGVGGSGLNTESFKPFAADTEDYRPLIGVRQDPETGLSLPEFGPPVEIKGFRLRDARGSYGFGLVTFAVGFPVHLDWSWKTLFNKDWEDALFAATGGSDAFREGRFDIWIGFDF
jgi:hypothetical protein